MIEHRDDVEDDLDDLRQLWLRAKPVTRARLQTLRDAAVAPPPPELFETAHVAAHKLAGSLGMYGLADSSTLARKVNELVESTRLDTPAARRELSGLLDELEPLVEQDR